MPYVLDVRGVLAYNQRTDLLNETVHGTVTDMLREGGYFSPPGDPSVRLNLDKEELTCRR